MNVTERTRDQSITTLSGELLDPERPPETASKMAIEREVKATTEKVGLNADQAFRPRSCTMAVHPSGRALVAEAWNVEYGDTASIMGCWKKWGMS
ncbi:MAG: hypothetical protein EA399_04385 [Desulfovibrionales bacterium]|nr:MAG: hypothetical protein EA399_04385 [Desulfovibrionales bacterium]